MYLQYVCMYITYRPPRDPLGTKVIGKEEKPRKKGCPAAAAAAALRAHVGLTVIPGHVWAAVRVPRRLRRGGRKEERAEERRKKGGK